MRFACWIIKTTGTHLEHVILLAFPRLKVTLVHALPVLFNLSLRSAMQKLTHYIRLTA